MVRAADKRAMFVGINAYEEAGGCVLRDLFQQDDGGLAARYGAVRSAGGSEELFDPATLAVD